MIGVIIVGHRGFASELVSLSQDISGKQKYLEAVSVNDGESKEEIHSKLEKLTASMGVDDFVILSDIFGGSISNACIDFSNNSDHIAVITGVNLPMVLKILTHRSNDSLSLKELVSIACEGGKDGILDACRIIYSK